MEIENGAVELLKCSKCLGILPSGSFYLNRNKERGYTSQCKKCITEWRNNNREVIREQSRRSRRNNLEKVREREKTAVDNLPEDKKLERKQKKREYWERTRDTKLEKMRSYNRENRKTFSAKEKAWRENNEDHVKEVRKTYREKNKESNKIKRKEKHEKNKEEENRKHAEYRRNRRKTDTQFRIQYSLRNRLYNVLKGKNKSGSAVKDLGCTLEELKAYLESRFSPGMTWENYGHGESKWNIDHVIPLSLFDLENRQHLVLACNYLNLQPMWHLDNLSKNNKMPEEWGGRKQ